MFSERKSSKLIDMCLAEALKDAQFVIIQDEFICGYDDNNPFVIFAKDIYQLPKSIVRSEDYIKLLYTNPEDVRKIHKNKDRIEVVLNNGTKIVLNILRQKIPKSIKSRLQVMESLYTDKPIGYIMPAVLDQLYEIIDEKSSVLLDEDKLICFKKGEKHIIWLQFDEDEEPFEIYMDLTYMIQYYRPKAIDIFEHNMETIITLILDRFVIYWFEGLENKDD